MKEYKVEDIEILTDREHVRKRTNVYLGNTTKVTYAVPTFLNNSFKVDHIAFIPAVYKAVGEIIDNSIDELIQIRQKNKTLKLSCLPALGQYVIEDNGRGIPIDLHSSGKYGPEVALGSLRAGRNFTDETNIGVVGVNGVGAACTNYCSDYFHVDIHRDKKHYQQSFTDGGLHVTKPSIRKSTSDKTGTVITFQLDKNVFHEIVLPNELIENRAVELALTNPGFVVEYNSKKYKFKNGFDDIIKKCFSIEKYYKFEHENMEFYVIFDNNDRDEQMFTWVNSSLLFDGGICNTQFLNVFFDSVISYLAPQAKKERCEIIKNDIRPGLIILGNLKLSNPSYDAQSKTRLIGPNLRKQIDDITAAHWSAFSRRNKEWFNTILERAVVRHHTRADAKAVKQHQKNLCKKVPGLVDATSKVRSETQLLITEGDSAAYKITEARNPKTTASFPLKGKVNNVYGCTVAQLLQMEKLTDLLSIIGLVPGQRAIRSNLRYGKIVIATDADVDGGDILALLVNVFYQYWPELFDKNYEPIIYRLVAPNVCVVKGKQRIHIPTRKEYEQQKDKYKGWEIRYYKGLASMQLSDWEMLLSGKTNTLIPFTDDGKMGEVLTLLFSPDSDARKEWLRETKNILIV
ncbi:MAG: toprim domain-containing protein [Nitrosopumilaceae archaeon]